MTVTFAMNQYIKKMFIAYTPTHLRWFPFHFEFILFFLEGKKFPDKKIKNILVYT